MKNSSHLLAALRSVLALTVLTFLIVTLSSGCSEEDSDSGTSSKSGENANNATGKSAAEKDAFCMEACLENGDDEDTCKQTTQ